MEKEKKLWDRLTKEFAHLDDNNYTARKVYDYVIKLFKQD